MVPYTRMVVTAFSELIRRGTCCRQKKFARIETMTGNCRDLDKSGLESTPRFRSIGAETGLRSGVSLGLFGECALTFWRARGKQVGARLTR